MEERVCILCGKRIEGRRGKKFCSCECKNAYNNRKASTIRKYRSSVMYTLSANYALLDTLLKNGVTTAELEDLSSMGFNPDIVTGSSRGRSGHLERRCYDISYCQTNVKIFNIKRMFSPEK